MRGQGGSSVAGVVVGGLASFALLVSGCGNDTGTDEAAAADVVQETDFVFEPADEPGEGAFTAPIDVAPEPGEVFQGFAGQRSSRYRQGGGCDPEKLIAELDERPAVKAEYARVLGIGTEDVNDYIGGLKSGVLGTNMRVTNHRLDDRNKAYPFAADLEVNTAVLIDQDESGKLGGPQPVTRCKSGNPLLKPPEIGAKRPEWVTTTAPRLDTTTTVPTDDVPPTTPTNVPLTAEPSPYTPPSSSSTTTTITGDGVIGTVPPPDPGTAVPSVGTEPTVPSFDTVAPGQTIPRPTSKPPTSDGTFDTLPPRPSAPRTPAGSEDTVKK